MLDDNGQMNGLIIAAYDESNRKLIENRLRDSEISLKERISYLNLLIENMNEVFCTYDLDLRFTLVNKKVQQVLGYEPGEMIGRNLLDFVVEEHKAEVQAIVKRRLEDGMAESCETVFQHKDGHNRYIMLNSTPIVEDGIITGGMLLAEDITERKLTEETLRESQQLMTNLINFLPDATFAVDLEGKIISWNKAVEELTGFKAEQMIGKGDYEYSIPFYGFRRPMLLDLVINPNEGLEEKYSYITRQNGTLFAEGYVKVIDENKSKRWAYFWGKASPLYDSQGTVMGAIETFRDITERKEYEERLRYLSLHDSLTGLYNRTYFEEELQKLGDQVNEPIGLIICDLDGLKFINDTMGHGAGDNMLVTAADIIKVCLRRGDIIARIGGDEFAILLPKITESTLERTSRKLKETINKYNDLHPDLPLSISIGYSITGGDIKSVDELFEKADNNMYQEKLHRSSSIRSSLVKTMMKALEARDYITEGHTDRLQELLTDFAETLNLPEQTINRLRLMARFHDIGKVGIPDKILFKRGPLTSEERIEMQRHCEIGYYIAQASPDLATIAEGILKHHEWWNGEGYPLKIKGEEIPLECRMLAIVDAFDAMTNDRHYRQAMSQEDAIKELKRCAGTQFEPLLVYKYAKMLEEKDDEGQIKVC